MKQRTTSNHSYILPLGEEGCVLEILHLRRLHCQQIIIQDHGRYRLSTTCFSNLILPILLLFLCLSCFKIFFEGWTFGRLCFAYSIGGLQGEVLCEEVFLFGIGHIGVLHGGNRFSNAVTHFIINGWPQLIKYIKKREAISRIIIKMLTISQDRVKMISLLTEKKQDN